MFSGPRTSGYFSSATTVQLRIWFLVQSLCKMSEKGLSATPPAGSQEFGPTTNSFCVSEVNEDLERKAVRRIDCTVLPALSMFYLLSFLVSVLGDLSTKFWC